MTWGHRTNYQLHWNVLKSMSEIYLFYFSTCNAYTGWLSSALKLVWMGLVMILSKMTTTLGTTLPVFWERCMGPLKFPADQWREVAGHNKGGFCLIGREQLRNPGILLAHPKRRETGFTIYHSNMRTLEYLTICKFHNKGNTFSSVFSLWPWVLVHSKAWTLNLPQGNLVLHNMSFNQV